MYANDGKNAGIGASKWGLFREKFVTTEGEKGYTVVDVVVVDAVRRPYTRTV